MWGLNTNIKIENHKIQKELHIVKEEPVKTTNGEQIHIKGMVPYFELIVIETSISRRCSFVVLVAALAKCSTIFLRLMMGLMMLQQS